jgi:hypothetical protein
MGQASRVGALLPYAAPSGGDTNQLLVRPLDTASELAETLVVHHSAGNRVNNGPVWSPDSLRMAYVSEGRLWVIGVGSDGPPQGAPTPIADGLPDSPTWQGDPRYLVYLTAGGLRRVSTEDARSEDLPVSLAWQPLAPDAVVVHAGAVFDGKSQELLRDVDIVVDRGRIRSVEPRRDDLHAGTVVDLHAGTVVDAFTDTVMPGLIDMHAHLESGYGEAQDVIDVMAKSGLALTPMIGAAMADFESGFTLRASRIPRGCRIRDSHSCRSRRPMGIERRPRCSGACSPSRLASTSRPGRSRPP